MLAAGAKVKKGFQSSQQHDHLGTLRLILQALGVTRFPGAAAAASDMSEFF
jgi:hypothetical protein